MYIGFQIVYFIWNLILKLDYYTYKNDLNYILYIIWEACKM